MTPPKQTHLRKALVIEEDASNRLVLHTLLNNMGLQVEEAVSLDAARAIGPTSDFDVVVLGDISRCPPEAELALCSRLTSGEEAVPVIVAASPGITNPHCADTQFKQAGAAAYIGKPYAARSYRSGTASIAARHED